MSNPNLPLSTLNAIYAVLPATGQNALTGYYHANGYGATGNGTTDDTAALNAWIAAIPPGGTGFLPPGTYLVTSALNQPATGVVIQGVGERSTLSYSPASAGTMWTLTNASRIHFIGIRFSFQGSTATVGSRLFTLVNTFRCSWTRCVFQGQHSAAADAYAITTGHIGVAITANSGDNMWYDSDFLNLGVGIATDSIQNGVNGGKFGTCYVGVLGTTNIDGDGQSGAGMSITGYVDFVSSSTAGLVKNNIWINGSANQWWLSHIWFEGADTPLLIGDSSGNGPTQFGITNSKLAATTVGIVIQSARQSYLANVEFAGNGAATPTPLTINATNAGQGTAINLINFVSGIGTDPFTSAFPNGTSGTTAGWTYLGRGQSYLPQFNYLQYGGSVRFIRSDGASAGLIGLSGSTVLVNGVNTSSGTLFQIGNNAASNPTANAIAQFDNITSPTNWIGMSNNSTGNIPWVDARGTDTNISLGLKTKGTGQIVANAPVVFPSYTTTARNALSGVIAGSTVYDTTLGYLVTYSGSVWKNQAGTTV